MCFIMFFWVFSFFFLFFPLNLNRETWKAKTRPEIPTGKKAEPLQALGKVADN